MNDLISRQAVKDWLLRWEGYIDKDIIMRMQYRVIDIPSTQPEQLTDDDISTIRIHLSACKEELCNQQRWKEAEEYQHIIDRLMAFASTQPELHEGHWIDKGLADGWNLVTDGCGDYWRVIECSECGKQLIECSEHGKSVRKALNVCPQCGAYMKGGE